MPIFRLLPWPKVLLPAVMASAETLATGLAGESERNLRLIIDSISEMIGVLDPSGAVLYANQATLDYSGVTAEDLAAPSFRERFLHPDDEARLRDVRKAAVERGLPFEMEQRGLRKDGHYRWFLVRYNPFRDEQGRLILWYVTGTDIDDLKRAEAKLRQDEEELRRITDLIPQAIQVLNPDGRVISPIACVWSTAD